MNTHKCAKWFVGGPYDGEIRACDESSISMMVPVVLSNGSTLHPPRFAAYVARGEDMVFVRDGSMDDCIAAMLESKRQTA